MLIIFALTKKQGRRVIGRTLLSLVLIIIAYFFISFARWSPDQPEPNNWQPSPCTYEGDGICW